MRGIAHICLYWNGAEVHLDITADDERDEPDEQIIIEAMTQTLTVVKEQLSGDLGQPSIQ